MPSARPRDWPVRRLLDLVELPQGQVDPRSHAYRHWPLIAPDHVESETGRLLMMRTAVEQRAVSGKYRVRPSDVVLSKIRPALRKVVRVKMDALCSADMYPLRPGPEIDSGFLFWLLLGRDFSTFAETRAGRSGIPKINRSELSEYELFLPSVPEQRRIAEILDEFDVQIEQAIQVLAKTKTTKGAVWDDLCARTDVPQVQLGRILQEHPRNGYSPVEATGMTGIFALGLGCLTLDGFVPRQLKPVYPRDPLVTRALLSDGDLLVSRSNTRDLVGIVGRYQEIGSPCIYPDLMMRLRPTDEIRPDFLEFALRSAPLRQQIHAAAQGTSGSMVKISASTIRSLIVPLPDCAEQDCILQSVRPWIEAQGNIERSLEKLRMIKKGLMDDLLTGKVRVGELSG